MCGIAGVATSADHRLTDLRERLTTMAHAMVHRGPDDEGIYLSPEGLVGLANRRLAIRDLSPAGRMPMATADESLWITYNGEIYNADDLRVQLEARGCVFRSHGDTEVILHGYRAWGEDVVDRLRGMFAFALYDRRQQRLFLARDPLGIKPLYYATQPGTFAFASECRTLLAAGFADATVRPSGLVAYLALGSVPAPLTIYRHVESLEAGHTLSVDLAGGSPSVQAPRSYWTLPTSPIQPMPYAEAVERTHAVLLESVRRHLVSDVPLGVFLSGGVDSSGIVALTREARPSAEIHTCSVSFAETEFDESAYARQVAEALGTHHVDVRVTAADVAGELQRVLAHLDQPSNDGINTYFVSRAARQAGATVALSGLGGDELFGGYPTFGRMVWLGRLLAVAARVPGGASLPAALTLANPRSPEARLGEWLLQSGAAPSAAYVGLRGVFPLSLIRRLVAPDLMAEARDELDLPRLATRAAAAADRGLWDLTSRFELASYMRHQLLRDADAMSMAHSLELRVPFVDREVVEAILALPVAARSAGPVKKLLRDALPLLPAPVRDRRDKQGFVFPFQRWMAGPLRSQVGDLAWQAHASLEGALTRGGVEHVLDGFDSGQSHWSRPWALAALNVLHQPAPTVPPRERPLHVSGAAPPASARRDLGRVLMLAPTTELIGGIQTSGRIAWEALARGGDATLFCYCAAGSPARPWSTSSEVHAGTKAEAAFTVLRRQWDADLVLVWHLGLLKLLPLFRLGKAKVAVGLFGIDAWEPLDPVTRMLAARADLLISISDYTWRRFVESNPSFKDARHAIVHLGLGEPLREETPPPAEPPVALMISRLEESERYKGHHEMIAAWPRVRAAVPSAELWIVGEGGLRPELERRARDAGVGESVRFFGAVSEQKKLDLVRASRLLALPSRKEGFGLVYLEAMRLGRPCLVSDADAGEEVVSPPLAGVSASPTDLPVLARAVERLLRDGPEWSTWSQQARERYETRFTAFHFQQRLIDSLGPVANNGC